MNNTIWARQIWEKIDAKLEQVAPRSANKIPYTTDEKGVHDDKQNTDITWWTNGFWPGLLWMMYGATEKPVYRTAAETAQANLRKAFEEYDGLHHDVGFMWHISSGVQYRLTGDRRARLDAMYAASLLAARYNADGGYIRAWNDNGDGVDNRGWAIIDCMMNIPLLYWASAEKNDPRFASIARKHADKTLQHHLRPDGSARHIVEYDPADGSFVREYGGQGYGEGSSWSRGQAWALYGFTLSWLYTKDVRYLDAAKRSAQYFISCVCDDWLPRCDFRAPATPVIYDSTAGAIAACGLLELAVCLGETEGAAYRRAAVNILQAMEEKFCDWDTSTDAILGMGTERYHGDQGRHIPIIYGDYFFVEAIAKLTGHWTRSW